MVGTMNKNYAIDDGNGNRIGDGLGTTVVWRTARRIATDRGVSVFVVSNDGDEVEIQPCIKAVVRERGNGFPISGCHVLGTDGLLYRVRDLVGPIHTDRPGRGSYVNALVELVDPSADEDPYHAIVEIDT